MRFSGDAVSARPPAYGFHANDFHIPANTFPINDPSSRGPCHTLNVAFWNPVCHAIRTSSPSVELSVDEPNAVSAFVAGVVKSSVCAETDKRKGIKYMMIAACRRLW